MRRLVLCVLGLFLLTGAVTVGRSTVISSDAPRAPHAESFLAIDPKDDRIMLATSSAIEGGALHSPVYVTSDGGRSWRRVHFPANDPITKLDGGDPTVYFAPSGRGYFITMGHQGFTLSYTDDGGRSWSRGMHTYVAGGFDRNYYAFDAVGRYAGRIYGWGDDEIVGRDGQSTSGLAVVSSLDGGVSFGASQVIVASGAFPHLAPIDLVVSPDGTLVMPLMASPPYDPKKKNRVPVNRLYAMVSTDGGATFSKAKPISRFTGTIGDATGGIPRAAIDLSDGPYRGRIYIVYFDAKGSGNVIDVVHSSDNGATWSAPARVDDASVLNGNANAAIAVNNRGVVAVIWNDRRANPKSLCYQLYTSVSTDGGATFSKNVRIRGKATCPTNPANFDPAVIGQSFPKGVKLIDLLMVPTRWSNGGDTQGLAASGDGVFHAVWIDGESGVMQIEQTDFSTSSPVVGSNRSGPGNVTTVAEAAAPQLGDQVELEIIGRDIDMQKGKIAITVRLRNSSHAAINGPLSLVYDHMLEGNLPNFTAVNSDNHVARKGASWLFLSAGTTLAPNAATQARVIRFAFSRLPAKPTYPAISFTVHR
jgi:hypothetical protein